MQFYPILILAALVARCAGDSSNGDISVTINGRIINPSGDQDVKLKNVDPGQTINVRGLHMQFDIDVPVLTLHDFVLTGFPDDRRLVSKPTLIFQSKTPVLASSDLKGLILSEVEVRAGSARLQFEFSGGKMKFQINDSPDHGILQIEPELSSPTEFIHILGPNVFYFVDPDINKILFTDGLGEVSKASDPLNYHQMLLGKDSPEAAIQTFQSGNESRWLTQPGGRVGQVFGQDALESASSSCTQQCQNQNQIHGSIPPPPNPTQTTPLPPRATN